MSFKDEIKKARPHLAESTVNTYNSILTNLAKKMGVDGSKKFYEDNSDKVLRFLKDMPASRRKTVLASLVVLTGGGAATDKYRDVMLKDASEYSDSLKDQTMTGKQKENWMSQKDVMNVYNDLYKDNYKLLSKPSLTNQDHKRLMDLVILSLYVLVPPRRSLDYCEMKIKDVDKDADNYIEGNKFVFNKYKTHSKYGKQTVAIPRKLLLLLRKWSSKQTADYLLTDERGNKLTPSKLTTRMNNIFGGKKISTNMLRKIFLSDKYKDIPALKEIAKTENDMGNSFNVQMTNYVKKDTKD